MVGMAKAEVTSPSKEMVLVAASSAGGGGGGGSGGVGGGGGDRWRAAVGKLGAEATR